MAFIDFAPSLAGGAFGAATAIIAGQIANKNATKREASTREVEEQRERLRDLRIVSDDAARAMRDLWSVLGAFAYAIPRGDPPVSRQSPTEARTPDPEAFVDAYERLKDAHVHLLNRVTWTDTFHAPVGRAVIDAQQAYNAVVNEDPFEQRTPRSSNAILTAIGSAQHGLHELQETSRQRFAPLGLPDSRYAKILVLTVAQKGPRLNEFLAALRTEPARHAKVDGPDKDGRVVVRDDEAEAGEARERLIRSLDEAGDDWRNYLVLDPEASEASSDGPSAES